MTLAPSSLALPKYRPDIDGLRAVAVLSVVAYHAFPKWLPGGFTGVDVFFVISGFLITRIVLDDLEAGSFGFVDFYARRVRRLFPALLLVLATSFAIAWIVLLPNEYAQLGKYMAAGAAFVANAVPWHEAGYFDSSAATKPLLHLWSLGIEEQFYALWPLLLWLGWKRRRSIPWIMAGVGIASFALNIAGIGKDAVGTFYAPQTRLWELACGGGLAWMGAPRKSAVSEALSVVGCLLLAWGMAMIDRTSSYPGALALVPVLGAGLVIAAGPQAWLNRTVLSNRLAVGIGLASFPLYLWHWPLLSFARIVEGDVPVAGTRIGIVLLSVLLAGLTWRFIERPVRLGWHGVRIGMLMLLMTIAGGVGYATYGMNGLAFRFPSIVAELTGYRYDFVKAYRQGTCFLTLEQRFEDFAKCDSPSDTAPMILLWGDSHAAHLYPGYKALYGKDFEIVQRTATTCAPVLGVNFASNAQCEKINDGIYAWLEGKRSVTVVLAAIWTHYDLGKLDETLAKLTRLGVRIEFVGPVPQWNEALPRQLHLHFQKHVPHVVPYRMSDGLVPNVARVDALLKPRVSAHGVNYISALDHLCNPQGCLTRLGETGDTLIGWDHAHLTDAGSRFLVGKIPRPTAPATRQ